MDLAAIDAMISSGDPSQRRAAASLLVESRGEDAYDRLELLLGDPNSGVRDAAQNAITLLGGRPAIARMLSLLSHTDPAVRNTAVDILRKVGIDGVDMLHACAKDPDDNVRLFILDILGTVGSHESVDTLIEGLYDVNPNVRNAAVISLGELGDPRSFEHLKTLINDEEWIRFSVIESLARIPHEGVVDFLLQELNRWSNDEITMCAILEALGVIGSHDAVRPLFDMLRTKGQYVRFAVARTLLTIMSIDDIASLDDSDRRTLKGILDAYLVEAEDEVQYRILSALERIGDSSSAEHIIDLAGKVDHDNEPDKWEAVKSALAAVGDIRTMVGLLDGDEKSVILGAEMLGRMGGEKEGRELASRVFSQQGYVKRAMTEALARIDGAGLRDTMIRLTKDRDGHVVATALRSLGEIGNPDDIRKIRKFLRHPYPDVRDLALEAIARIGTVKAEECFLALAEDGDPKLRIMALDGLQRVMSPRLGQVCIYMLKDQDWEVRMSAVMTVRNAGLHIENDLLVALLNDEHDEIRHPALDIVGMRRITGLRTFLEEAIDSDDMWTSCHAIEALGKFRDEDAKSRLLSVLKKGPDFLRISAVKALGEWEDRSLAAELEVYLDDENLDVARAAAEAVDRLQGVSF